MMSTDSKIPQTAANGNGGSTRTPCPLYGCKRVYTDTRALETHIKDHEISAQSLPEKVLLCSAVGCSRSFPCMQKLMEHMRHHHKPNIFFLCESCRTKLRSYRGLLTHLHTCAKVPRGKTKSTEPVPTLPATETIPNMTSVAVDQKPPQWNSVFKSQDPNFQIPNLGTSLPTALPQSDSAAPPLLCSPFLSNQDSLPPQLAPDKLIEDGQLQLRNKTSKLSLSLSLAGQAAVPPPDTQSQHQTQTRSPASAPNSPPGSTAVWKKNQGIACNRRILWEHTKGRYTCVQCGHMGTSRKEMTQHINSQHSCNRATETDSTVSSAYT